MSLQQMEDDFIVARDRVFKRTTKARKSTFKLNCNKGHHDYEKDGTYDNVYNWLKCKVCGIKCLGLK